MAQTSVNTLTTLFNGTVNLGLSQTGANVVRLDVAGLLNEIIAAPAAHGFDNVTGSACPAGMSSLARFSTTPGFNSKLRLFVRQMTATPAAGAADDWRLRRRHAGRTVLRRLLPAAGARASAGQYATLDQRHRSGLAEHTSARRPAHFAQYGYQPFRRPGRRRPGWRRYSMATPWAWEAQFSPNTRAGLALGYQYGKSDGARSNFTLQAAKAGGLSQQSRGQAVEADVFVANNAYRLVSRSFNPQRQSQKPAKPTATSGMRLTGRYHWQSGVWTVSPLLGVAYENIRVAGYGENGAASTAMRFSQCAALAGKAAWAWMSPA